MTSKMLLGSSVLVAALVACGGEGGSAFVEDFVDACTANANMPDGVCECMAELAEEEISPDAQELLLAILQGDEDTAAELRSEIPIAEAMQAGMFMTEAGRCAQELGAPVPNDG